MQKVISFCLWGNNPKYLHGAVRNAALAQYVYPDWQARFYIGADVPSKTIEQLEYYAAELWSMPEGFEGWKGMFARFLPASDEAVDVFISRDCDSRLNHREAAAVKEWLDSQYLVSCIQDHPWHLSRIMLGGLIGFKKYACPQIKDLIYKYIKEYDNAWDCDQSFLQDKILPIIRHKILLHSDFTGQRIPYSRNGLEFCGEIFDENDQPNQQHRQILSQYVKS